jgi:hypothetical protein
MLLNGQGNRYVLLWSAQPQFHTHLALVDSCFWHNASCHMAFVTDAAQLGLPRSGEVI